MQKHSMIVQEQIDDGYKKLALAIVEKALEDWIYFYDQKDFFRKKYNEKFRYIEEKLYAKDEIENLKPIIKLKRKQLRKIRQSIKILETEKEEIKPFPKDKEKYLKTLKQIEKSIRKENKKLEGYFETINEIAEIEKFFLSQYFKNISSLDGKDIVKKLQEKRKLDVEKKNA